MRRHRSHAAPAAAAALTVALLVSACGNSGVVTKPDPKAAGDAPGSVDTSAGEGDWLLGVTTAGGEDAETSSTVYITYNPSTGEATQRALPGVKAGSTAPGAGALLVSTDHQWAIPDTGIATAEGKSGRLTVYSVSDETTKVLDIRALTGERDLKALGWAFDPQRPDTLRVVDSANRVWAVSVTGTDATQEGVLEKGPWLFTDGFNRNTGQPWVESIDSDATMPAGNGAADTAPVTRDGGTVLASDSEEPATLPKSPCRLGGGFTDGAGVTWMFCTDKPEVSTYYLAKDAQEWKAYGKPSAAVAPAASGVTVVLPPAE